MAACRLWLDAEIGILKPQVVVCLGATAAQALISPSFKVTKRRGKLVPSQLAPPSWRRSTLRRFSGRPTMTPASGSASSSSQTSAQS
ncbi:MAG: hypothetical protein M3O99_02860 [Chloroflexota bacterium]|nr:hypothetical protein [Chloroflexota bacterium]